jgi:hypothetical protein
MLDAPRSDTMPRWLLILARVRQWIAVALLTYGAVVMSAREIKSLIAQPLASYDFDPAALFYLAGAIGFAVRAFWARYLAICFAIALLTLDVFWRDPASVWSAFGVGAILLVSGRSMRALFEQRDSRLNRWATVVDARIHRLRGLFIAQAIALAMLWAAGSTLSTIARPLTLVAGLAIGGLVFQRAWGALLLAPVLAGEAYLAVLAFGQKVHLGDPPAWAFPAVLLAVVIVSLAVLAPFLRGVAGKLATERPPAV